MHKAVFKSCAKATEKFGRSLVQTRAFIPKGAFRTTKPVEKPGFYTQPAVFVNNLGTTFFTATTTVFNLLTSHLYPLSTYPMMTTTFYKKKVW